MAGEFNGWRANMSLRPIVDRANMRDEIELVDIHVVFSVVSTNNNDREDDDDDEEPGKQV